MSFGASPQSVDIDARIMQEDLYKTKRLAKELDAVADMAAEALV